MGYRSALLFFFLRSINRLPTVPIVGMFVSSVDSLQLSHLINVENGVCKGGRITFVIVGVSGSFSGFRR